MPFETPKYALPETPPAEVRYLASKDTIKKNSSTPPAVKPYDHNPYARFKPVKITEIRLSQFSYLPIESMKLKGTSWWQNSDIPGSPPTGYDLTLNPQGDKETELTFECAGRAAADDSELRKILRQPAHSLTENEQAALHDGHNNVYKKAHSEKLNGKTVLIESGYLDSDGKNLYKVEFNHNPDGAEPFVPATILFSAKPEKYKELLAAVLASLKTIKWDERAYLAP